MSEMLPPEEQMNEQNFFENNGEPASIRAKQKAKSKRKKLIIFGCALAVAVAAILPFVIKSEFERVKDEVGHIVSISYGKDYFTIDTYPDTYENMDEVVAALLLPEVEENALEAIRYANEELGFNGALYSNMLETSALMGRQSAETSKYRVTWTYHPDDGLEVTYEKK